MYSDFHSMANLRGAARQDADASLAEVAAQFESLFVQMMLKAMRDATPEGGLFDSNQLDSYRQMHDQQLSLELSNQGGIGLADVLIDQLRSDRAVSSRASEVPEAGIALQPEAAGSAAAMELQSYRDRALPAIAPQARAAALPGDAASAPRAIPKDAAEFAAQLAPAAKRAGERLGLDAEVLLAQAALETGWGRHLSADQRGSSNNFFNIKAGDDWPGRSVSVQTVEYRDGVAVRETARFRAYSSAEESFEDYVDLIENSPRYRGALSEAGSAENYLRELQRAGYATDPQYADKVLSILMRGGLQGAPSELKVAAKQSLKG